MKTCFFLIIRGSRCRAGRPRRREAGPYTHEGGGPSSTFQAVPLSEHRMSLFGQSSFGQTTSGFGTGSTLTATAGSTNPMKDVEVASAPDDSISCLRFSPPSVTNTNFLIAGSWDNNVRCWEIQANGQSEPKTQQSMQVPYLRGEECRVGLNSCPGQKYCTITSLHDIRSWRFFSFGSAHRARFSTSVGMMMVARCLWPLVTSKSSVGTWLPTRLFRLRNMPPR